MFLLKKFEIGKTEITDKTILVALSSDEIHLIREALFDVQKDPKYNKEEIEIANRMRSSVTRILLDPYQRNF